MIQVIVEKNDRWSIPEVVQMAIEAGCGWIVLRMPDSKAEEVRETAAELVPLCKETSTMLSIENNIDTAKELGVHGVYLRNCDQSAMAVREKLGPEAIIGVEVGIASAATALVPADIDYVVFGPQVPMDRLSENVEVLREAKFELPIVAEGNYTAENADAPIAAGANGILTTAVSHSSDPLRVTEKLLSSIKG